MSAVTERYVPPHEARVVPDGPGLRWERAGIRFHEVTKRFDDGTEALRAIGFSVGPGELVAVVGPSGCGKSTLLRLASGLTAPTSGHVEVGPGPVGYVFQDATLLPWRTVLGNVELLGQLNGVLKSDRQRAALAAIQTVGLSGFEHKYPRALSGGMKMRVSLARASLCPRTSFFSTSRSVPSTRSPASGSTKNCCSCSRTACSRPCSSPTLSPKRFSWPPGPGYVRASRSGNSRYPRRICYPRKPELRYSAAFAKVAGQVGAALQEGHS